MPSSHPPTAATSTVIVPAAKDGYGPLQKPCWLRQHPAGLLVIHHLLKSLDLSLVSRVVIVTSKEHVDKWLCGDVGPLIAHLRASSVCPVTTSIDIFPLPMETSNAAATVACAIRHCGIEGSIFVKDQDGSFAHKVVPNVNYVVGLKLTEETEVDSIPAKSFLLTTGALLSNIVEKKIVSDTIGLGGYAFQSAHDFLATLERVEQVHARVVSNLQIGVQQSDDGATAPNPSTTTAASKSSASPPGSLRLFLSHIVQYQMLHENRVFGVDFSNAFCDWKTEEAWRHFAQRHRNVDVALEGVLFLSDAPFDVVGNLNAAHLVPVASNIDYLRSMPRYRTHITIRTTRAATDLPFLQQLLKQHDVPYDAILTDCRAATTFLVTPFGGDSHLSHPSGVAYSIPESPHQQLGSVLHFPPH